MSVRRPPETSEKTTIPGAVAVLVAVLAVAGLGAAAFGLNRVAGPGTAYAVATPAPKPTPTPAPSIIPFADCSKVSFGDPLQPDGAPADIHKYSAAPAMQIDVHKLYRAVIATKYGDISVCLQPDLAPKTVNNFVVLARNHFFDGLTFHRVVAGFVIQGGDPTGTGSGGPGYSFADEPIHQHYVEGCMAMANSGPNTNGSQWFICTADDSTLPAQYNLFGKVESGMDAALAVQQGDLMQTVTVSEQK